MKGVDDKHSKGRVLVVDVVSNISDCHVNGMCNKGKPGRDVGLQIRSKGSRFGRVVQWTLATVNGGGDSEWREGGMG